MDGGHYGAVVARRTKRLWTDEEKRSICFQATAPGAPIAQVARRYAMLKKRCDCAFIQA